MIYVPSIIHWCFHLSNESYHNHNADAISFVSSHSYKQYRSHYSFWSLFCFNIHSTPSFRSINAFLAIECMGKKSGAPCGKPVYTSTFVGVPASRSRCS
jgi:hypothetical protein